MSVLQFMEKEKEGQACLTSTRSNNLMNINLVAAASIRNDVSTRAAAEIATAALISAGVIHKNNPNSLKLVIDHKKVDRAKNTVTKEQQCKDNNQIIEK